MKLFSKNARSVIQQSTVMCFIYEKVNLYNGTFNVKHDFYG